MSATLRSPWRSAVRLLAAAASAVVLTAGATAPASAHDGGRHGGHGGDRATYYVSLGDSLAAGYQPDVHRDTDVSYTDRLYERLKKDDPRLVHVRLGCSGETTTSMIVGGRCSYPGASSQLDAATRFLSEHRGRVRFLTVDIGANDIGGCLAGGAIDTACVSGGLDTVARNLPRITLGLRAAGGGAPRYAGMSYYNPYLALWLTGAAGQATARQSGPLQDRLTSLLTSEYRGTGFAVAAVGQAFSSGDFATTVQLPGVGGVPLNVARICQWTWECTPYRDIHANPLGHQVIADAFAAALHRHHGGR
ncbi:SGNH/GDSL hydrolase family protein [Streptacidiphilus sp. ASG 303]|uniref:SGNH/GDSL hydrolase family protein n=1 Tax=Streptacidiphilus sp. ASG 303 TaxID=2896847 RepID=UPI001E5C9D22|nr:SGNH/GDSL hydrolase family protein [Streptacidiphilus sp. ASG 303]MCD0483931.1 SGNH/GDSL hydrolase family protein [Streptacidiphilus sp. ASG 303]